MISTMPRHPNPHLFNGVQARKSNTHGQPRPWNFSYGSGVNSVKPCGTKPAEACIAPQEGNDMQMSPSRIHHADGNLYLPVFDATFCRYCYE
jgi:hypothetical protein